MPSSVSPAFTGAPSTNSLLFLKVKLEADEFAAYIVEKNK